MKSKYKFSIPAVEKPIINLPKDAQILRAEQVDGLFFLWAIVDTFEECEKEDRYLELYKTGQLIETPLRTSQIPRHMQALHWARTMSLCF